MRVCVCVCVCMCSLHYVTLVHRDQQTLFFKTVYLMLSVAISSPIHSTVWMQRSCANSPHLPLCEFLGGSKGCQIWRTTTVEIMQHLRVKGAIIFNTINTVSINMQHAGTSTQKHEGIK